MGKSKKSAKGAIDFEMEVPKAVSAALKQGNKRWTVLFSIREFGTSLVSGKRIGVATNASRRTETISQQGVSKGKRKRKNKPNPKPAKDAKPAKAAKAAKPAKSAQARPGPKEEDRGRSRSRSRPNDNSARKEREPSRPPAKPAKASKEAAVRNQQRAGYTDFLKGMTAKTAQVRSRSLTPMNRDHSVSNNNRPSSGVAQQNDDKL